MSIEINQKLIDRIRAELQLPKEVTGEEVLEATRNTFTMARIKLAMAIEKLYKAVINPDEL